jgi:hypothetical protein
LPNGDGTYKRNPQPHDVYIPCAGYSTAWGSVSKRASMEERARREKRVKSPRPRK